MSGPRPRSRGTRIAVLAAVAAATLSGCAFSSSGQVRDIDPLSLPPRLLPPPISSIEPSPSTTSPTARVYFIAGEDLLEAFRTPQMGSGRSALQELLNELTAGPTSSDRRQGLSTALTPATRITVTDLADGLATVDLTVDQPPPDQTTAIAQIVLTATSLPGITALNVTINGEAINPPLVGGAQTDRPLTRDDYVALLAPKR